MQEVTRELVELLDLLPVGNDHFSGNSQDLGFPAVFGGQVLGQALMAACRTVEGRQAHSMHAYFLRPGDPSEPIDYEVHRVRDGGSFSTRRILAKQRGKEILTAMVSFQIAEEGLDHQIPMPPAPDYASLDTELDQRRRLEAYMPEQSRKRLMQERSIEIRPVAPTDPLNPSIRPPHKQQWLRALGELPDDPVLHRCLLAYASDFSLLATSLNPHGRTFVDPSMQVASLDHAIWFHREFRMDDWLLYDMDSPSASHARGFNRGNVFSKEGVLVASTTQEALIRRHSAKQDKKS